MPEGCFGCISNGLGYRKIWTEFFSSCIRKILDSDGR